MTTLARLEHRVTAVLRSRTAQVIGFVAGLVAIIALVARLTRDMDAALQTVRGIGIGGVLIALVLMVAWQVAPIAIAARFGVPDPAGVWARAQILKYVPVPASAAAGFIGSAVRAGSSTRDSVSAMVRQTGALTLGAGTVGTIAVWRWAAATATPLAVGVLAVGLLGLVAAWFLALRNQTWRTAGGIAVVGWSVAGLGFGLGLGGDEPLLVGSAVLASWVAGQIVVPVPAGLGVREFTLVVLVQHALGIESALVIAVMARLVHTAADAITAAVILGHGRYARPPTGEEGA